jgi:hypothetical protein
MSAAFDRFVAALGDRVTRRHDDKVDARCPAHDDGHASLSVSVGDNGTVLLKCFAGCSAGAIVTSLGLRLADLFEWSGGAGSSSYRTGVEHSTTPRSGVTLADYAAAKRRQCILQSPGVSGLSPEPPAVRIPYFARDGSVAMSQFRLSLDGDDRFRWKSGSKPTLYGLHRLAPGDAITVVEGASDCHTLWWHDLAALGLPSASAWRPAWDQVLEGIATIYVVIEPDRGGDAVQVWLHRASFRDRVKLLRLADGKDPSASYLHDPESFPERWQADLAAAVPGLTSSVRDDRTPPIVIGRLQKHLLRTRDCWSTSARRFTKRVMRAMCAPRYSPTWRSRHDTSSAP